MSYFHVVYQCSNFLKGQNQICLIHNENCGVLFTRALSIVIIIFQNHTFHVQVKFHPKTHMKTYATGVNFLK